MTYNCYITKKRTRIRGMLGQDFNIPANTICTVSQQNIIYYKDRPVCYTTSQNCKDYFYGWADENPEEELERQKVMEKLLDMHPDFEVSDSKHYITAWQTVGWMEPIGNGFVKWHWNQETLDSSIENLNYLIDCIKDKTCPFTLKIQ